MNFRNQYQIFPLNILLFRGLLFMSLFHSKHVLYMQKNFFPHLDVKLQTGSKYMNQLGSMFNQLYYHFPHPIPHPNLPLYVQY